MAGLALMRDFFFGFSFEQDRTVKFTVGSWTSNMRAPRDK